MLKYLYKNVCNKVLFEEKINFVEEEIIYKI